MWIAFRSRSVVVSLRISARPGTVDGAPYEPYSIPDIGRYTAGLSEFKWCHLLYTCACPRSCELFGHADPIRHADAAVRIARAVRLPARRRSSATSAVSILCLIPPVLLGCRPAVHNCRTCHATQAHSREIRLGPLQASDFKRVKDDNSSVVPRMGCAISVFVWRLFTSQASRLQCRKYGKQYFSRKYALLRRMSSQIHSVGATNEARIRGTPPFSLIVGARKFATFVASHPRLARPNTTNVSVGGLPIATIPPIRRCSQRNYGRFWERPEVGLRHMSMLVLGSPYFWPEAGPKSARLPRFPRRQLPGKAEDFRF